MGEMSKAEANRQMRSHVVGSEWRFLRGRLEFYEYEVRERTWSHWEVWEDGQRLLTIFVNREGEVYSWRWRFSSLRTQVHAVMEILTQ